MEPQEEETQMPGYTQCTEKEYLPRVNPSIHENHLVLHQDDLVINFQDIFREPKLDPIRIRSVFHDTKRNLPKEPEPINL